MLLARRPATSGVALVITLSLAIPPVSWSGGGGGPTYYWELSDPLGTGRVLLDEDGGRVRHTLFAPFGKEYSVTGPRILREYYAGHRVHTPTGLVYMQARWYDPGAGTFLSIDPVVANAFDPQSVNAYAYARNNPVNLADPTGMFSDCAIGCTTVVYGFTATNIEGPITIGILREMTAWDGPVTGPPPSAGSPGIVLNGGGGGSPQSQRDAANGPSPASKFPDIPESGTVANVEGWQVDFVAWTYGRGRAYAVDSHGNYRVFETETWGGIGEAIGASLYVGRQWTNAQNVDELGGESASVGVSLARKAYTVTIERNIGRSYQGTTVVGGASGGLNPAAPFGVVEYWTPVPIQPGVPFR